MTWQRLSTFLSRVQVEPGFDSCWLWTGRIDRAGYSRQGDDSAYRLSYEMFVGPIPAGLSIDHVCRDPRCVNPEHLEPVTHLENMRRRYATQVECSQGHLYDEANTYIRPNGHRDCRRCTADRQRRYQARRAAA